MLPLLQTPRKQLQSLASKSQHTCRQTCHNIQFRQMQLFCSSLLQFCLQSSKALFRFSIRPVQKHTLLLISAPIVPLTSGTLLRQSAKRTLPLVSTFNASAFHCFNIVYYYYIVNYWGEKTCVLRIIVVSPAMSASLWFMQVMWSGVVRAHPCPKDALQLHAV